MMTFTTTLDAPELERLLRDAARGRTVLLDCRFDLANPDAGRQAFLAGHIPGASFADLNQDLASPVTAGSGRHPLPTPAALREFCASRGIDDGTQVIAYDEANGAFAARAWWLLRWLGHSAVAVLDGGLRAWVAGGGSLEPGAPSAAPRRAATGLTARPALQAVVSSDQMLQVLADPARLVVDARAPERFAGTVEPLDTVAGHVPGAVNQPFTGNLNADGRFLAQDELRRRWLLRLGGAPPAAVILMCGSGVTACHNALAMELAGLGGAQLYAGSWSEWIRDPARPVARGAGEPSAQ